MKAPQFAYAKPRSLPEALELLERPGAKVLAGGQSLIPTLNMRLSSPELLVDIGSLGFSKIELSKETCRIGALTTHAQIEASATIFKAAAEKTREVADLVTKKTAQVAMAANEHASSSQEVTAAAEEQSASTEEMASSASELLQGAQRLTQLVGEFKT